MIFWVSLGLSSLLIILASQFSGIAEFIIAIPDFSLVILTVFSIRFGANKAPWLGFVTGLIQDFVSLSPLGFHALTRTLVGYFLGLGKGKIYLDQLLLPFLLGLVVTILNSMAEVLLSTIFSLGFDFSIFLELKFWMNALYNAALTPLFLMLIDRFGRQMLNPYTEKD